MIIVHMKYGKKYSWITKKNNFNKGDFEDWNISTSHANGTTTSKQQLLWKKEEGEEEEEG